MAVQAPLSRVRRSPEGVPWRLYPVRERLVVGCLCDSHAVYQITRETGKHTRSVPLRTMEPARASWARVGYQGEPGAYSEEAALAILPAAVTVGYPTFSRAFDAVAGREVDASGPSCRELPGGHRAGGQRPAVGAFRAAHQRRGHPPVRHCLLGRGEPVVRALFASPGTAPVPPLSRSAEHPGGEYHDTAGAARAVAEGMVIGSAAIASAAAARRYGLKILAEGIQDDDSNQTRFLIIDRGQAARPGAPA